MRRRVARLTPTVIPLRLSSDRHSAGARSRAPKVESAAIEAGVQAAGLPASFVGVVMALLVLLPEMLAAVRAAARNRVQTSLNLALGSAMASIGLTVSGTPSHPSGSTDPVHLGLESLQVVLPLWTVVVSAPSCAAAPPAYKAVST